MDLPPPPDRRRTDRRDSALPSATEIERLAAELPRAIARHEITVLFQPQVRIADDRITGVEALARWDHPALGALGADPLFAAAERSAGESALSAHIQARALAVAAAWPDALSRLGLALNVTAGDLMAERFAEALLDRIAASGFAPGRLTVEITETALITDLPGAAAALDRLRDAGVAIAIDDFGAGYAGLGYLRGLPFDRLKIDRSLVADIADSARGRAVVRGIVALAGALDLSVVAEGVETAAQRACLAEEGCGWYQGFLCAGALDTASLVELLDAREANRAG